MSQTKKALFVVPVDAPGGAERVMATAAMEMIRRGGWEITVISLSRRIETSFLDRLDKRIEVKYGQGRGAFPSEWPAVLRLPKQEFDLVFATHFRINAALSTARRLGFLNTKRLVTRDSTVLADRSGGARLLAYKGLYRAYGSQDEIWAQTSYMAERVREVVPRSAAHKVRVSPNPVDVTTLRKRAAEPLADQCGKTLRERPYIVWCGRLIDIKNPLLAVDALRTLHDLGCSEIGLLMIGAGPLENQVREAAARKGLTEDVLLAGQQTNPFALMRACQAGLLTSRREGFPNVLLEMMSVGVPRIVTTDCAGDLKSLSGVQVVQSPDPTALALALLGQFRHHGSAADYAAALSARTPVAFADRLLGE